MQTKTKQPIRLVFPIVFLILVTLACGAIPSAVTFGQPPVPTAAPILVAAPPTPVAVAVPVAVASEQELLVNLYARINPSVVNITIYVEHGGQVLPYSQGSGFVYDTDRHIVTNAHVVQDANQIEVTFSDGTVSAATLTGADENSDLAVIQAEKMPAGVAPIPLGDMSQLAVGQTVVAIGNPFGLDGTLTRGVISALGRSIAALNQYRIPQAIQTDAAINPGNSGGPLLNLNGEVIGVNAQIETSGVGQGNTGVGFAIPVSIIKRVVPDLVESGKTEWAWLGVSGGDVNPTLAQAMSLPTEQGAYISSVISGGPADRAGLRGSTGTDTVNGRQTEIGGDVVTAIDGQPVRSFDDILLYLALQTRPDQEIVLTLVRDGKTLDVSLKLGTRPATVPDTQQP